MIKFFRKIIIMSYKYIGVRARLTCFLKKCWISISHMHTQQCTQYQNSSLHIYYCDRSEFQAELMLS